MDVLKILAPEKANWDCKLIPSRHSRSHNPSRTTTSHRGTSTNKHTDIRHMEGLLPKLYSSDATEIPGARSLLTSLINNSGPWAIVTSGTEPLVTGWLSVLNLAIPEHLITAESVEEGKPHPACYRLGRERLGLQDDDKEILVFEDAPAGIKAGKAAGCKVIGLVTSHTLEQVVQAGPDWVLKDLESIQVVDVKDGRVTVEIRDALVQ